MRTIIPHHVNVKALTAMATKGMRKEILWRLSMTTPTIINVSPEKSNIFLAVQEKTSIENCLESIYGADP